MRILQFLWYFLSPLVQLCLNEWTQSCPCRAVVRARCTGVQLSKSPQLLQQQQLPYQLHFLSCQCIRLAASCQNVNLPISLAFIWFHSCANCHKNDWSSIEPIADSILHTSSKQRSYQKNCWHLHPWDHKWMICRLTKEPIYLLFIALPVNIDTLTIILAQLLPQCIK